jgi:hypothetical protein
MPMKLLLVNQLLVNRVAKIEIEIKLFLENVEKFHNTFFWPENKTPFYRFVSDPVSDPDSNPDSNPDPKCLFRILTDPDPAKSFGSLRIRIRNTARKAV